MNIYMGQAQGCVTRSTGTLIWPQGCFWHVQHEVVKQEAELRVHQFGKTLTIRFSSICFGQKRGTASLLQIPRSMTCPANPLKSLHCLVMRGETRRECFVRYMRLGFSFFLKLGKGPLFPLISHKVQPFFKQFEVFPPRPGGWQRRGVLPQHGDGTRLWSNGPHGGGFDQPTPDAASQHQVVNVSVPEEKVGDFAKVVILEPTVGQGFKKMVVTGTTGF